MTDYPYIYIAIVSIVALYSSWRVLVLSWRLKHEFRAPTGNFRLSLSQGEWDKGVKQGAFAVAITNKENEVVFTLVMERKGGESTGTSLSVSPVRGDKGA